MVKQVKREVTRADVLRILRDIDPQLSSSEITKQQNSANREYKKRKAATQSAYKKRAKSNKRRAGNSIDKAAGISVGSDGKKQYAKTGKNSTPETDKYLAQAKRAELEQKKLTGTEREKREPSVFERVVDNLSRGMYASAEAFKEGFDPKTKAFWEPKEALKGFASGARLKEKTTFKDVLKQHGHTGKGMGTLGFALDVFADPTTYMGVGLVGKAARGGKALAEGLEDTVRLADKVTDANKQIGRQPVLEALGADRINVKQIKRRQVRQLSPAARTLYNEIKSTQKATGVYGKTAVGASGSSRLGRTVDNSAYKTFINLDEVTDPVIRDALQGAVEAELKAVPGLNKPLRRVKTSGEKTTGVSSKEFGSTTFGKIWNDPEALRQTVEGLTKGWSTVPVKTPAQLARYVATHEIGHHVAYSMPKTVEDEILEEVRKNPDVRDWITKNLSAYGAKNSNEMFAEAWAEYRIAGSKARPFAKEIGKAMEKFVIREEPNKRAAKLLESLGEDTIKVAKLDIQEDLARELSAKLGRTLTDDEMASVAKQAEQAVKIKELDKLPGELAVRMAENLSPKAKKQLAIRVGGAKFAVPAVAAAFGKTAQTVGSPQFIQKSVKTFNDTFRANAHIPESLRLLRSREYSIGANLVREYGREIQSVWDVVPASVRRDIALAYGRGETLGVAAKGGVSARDNLPVENVMEYLDDELIRMADTIYKNDVMPWQLNSQLPDKYHVVHKKANFNGETIDIEPDTNWFVESVKNAMRNGKVTDPGKALFAYNAALNQSIAKNTIWKTVADTHGVTFDGMGKELANQGWKPARLQDGKGEILHELQDQVFHPEIADAIGRMADVFSSAKSTGELLQQYDRVLLTVKGILTKYNPSFHPRTLMGEMILGYLGGMKMHTMGQSYHMAAKVLHGRNQEFLGQMAPVGKASKRNIQASNVLRNPRGVDIGAMSSAKNIMRTRWGTLNADTIWHHYMNSGLKSGFASTDMVRGVDSTVGGKIPRMVGDATQKLTESIEDIGRLAHFVDAIRHSKAKTLQDAIDEASMAVRKAHLDYTEVTGFEKSFMARVFPFYKWLRLSTPLMAEILLTQPGKAMVIPKAMDFATRDAGYDPDNLGTLPGGPDAAVPEYLLDDRARPVGFINGNSQWFNPTSLVPFAGSAGLAEEANDNPLAAIFNQVNPAVTAPIEYGLNKQTMGAPPQDDPRKFWTSQTPQTNYARKALTGEDPDVSQTELLLKFLGNPGLQSNTPRTIQGAAYQEQQKAYTSRREAKRKAGLLEPKK